MKRDNFEIPAVLTEEWSLGTLISSKKSPKKEADIINLLNLSDMRRCSVSEARTKRGEERRKKEDWITDVQALAWCEKLCGTSVVYCDILYYTINSNTDAGRSVFIQLCIIPACFVYCSLVVCLCVCVWWRSFVLISSRHSRQRTERGVSFLVRRTFLKRFAKPASVQCVSVILLYVYIYTTTRVWYTYNYLIYV